MSNKQLDNMTLQELKLAFSMKPRNIIFEPRLRTNVRAAQIWFDPAPGGRDWLCFIKTLQLKPGCKRKTTHPPIGLARAGQ